MASSGDDQQIEQLLVKKYDYSPTLASEAAQRASDALVRQPEFQKSDTPQVKRPLPSIADEDDTPTQAVVQEHPSGGKSGTEHQAAAIIALLRDKYGYPTEWAAPAAWRAKAALQMLAAKEVEQPIAPTKPMLEKVVRSGPDAAADEPPETSIEDPPSTAAYSEPAATSEEFAKPDSQPAKPADSAKPKPKPDGRILLIACPRCGFPLKLPESMFEQMKGRKARCPECEVKFLLPESLG